MSFKTIKVEKTVHTQLKELQGKIEENARSITKAKTKVSLSQVIQTLLDETDLELLEEGE
jgi:predicted CopG family antitoxin